MTAADIIVSVAMFWSVLMVGIGVCLIVAALGWELAIAARIRGWRE